MSLSARVAARFLLAAAPDLSELQDRLEVLYELSSNLDAIEDAFDAHFNITAGVLTPQVKSQFDVLHKAMEGLKAAKEIQRHADVILSLDPADKTAQRTKVEADRMVEKYSRHEDSARKIIRTISKKEMPPALKKEAAVATKIIESRLVNPSDLDVVPWQNTVSILIPGGQTLEVAQYQMVFKIKTEKIEDLSPRLVEHTGTEKPGVFGMFGRYDRGHFPYNRPMTGKEFAQMVLDYLVGWPGLKGEAEASVARSSTAQAVAGVVSSVSRSLGWMSNETTISADNLVINGAYRSNLPKEGAYEVGEYEYDNMVREETRRCAEALKAKLKPYQDKIKKIDIHDEEKSWIYITVTLK